MHNASASEIPASSGLAEFKLRKPLVATVKSAAEESNQNLPDLVRFGQVQQYNCYNACCRHLDNIWYYSRIDGSCTCTVKYSYLIYLYIEHLHIFSVLV
jgi:hypothetical protein